MVCDFGVDVNGYAEFGKRPPLIRPGHCPACGAPDALWSHGVRARGVWLMAVATVVVIYVRRLRCRRRACGATFTVLPSCVQPFKRYALEPIEGVVAERFVESRSFRAIEKRFPEGPSPSTQRDWCSGFARGAARWLQGLTAWLASLNPAMVLLRRTETAPATGLLATALQYADWLHEFSAPTAPLPRRVLEPLWLWGAPRAELPLLFSTRCRAGPPLRRSQTSSQST